MLLVLFPEEGWLRKVLFAVIPVKGWKSFGDAVHPCCCRWQSLAVQQA